MSADPDIALIALGLSHLDAAAIAKISNGVDMLFRDLIAISRLAGYEPYSQAEYERARRRQLRHARRQRIIDMWGQRTPQE